MNWGLLGTSLGIHLLIFFMDDLYFLFPSSNWWGPQRKVGTKAGQNCPHVPYSRVSQILTNQSFHLNADTNSCRKIDFFIQLKVCQHVMRIFSLLETSLAMITGPIPQDQMPMLSSAESFINFYTCAMLANTWCILIGWGVPTAGKVGILKKKYRWKVTELLR